jgi:osmotically-inducible protein OsmY
MRTDKDITNDVKEALVWEPSITPKDIHVVAEGGVVTLTGFVPSYAEKRSAEKVARRVMGVKAIAEDLKVATPGSIRRTDTDIAKAVTDALRWHVWVPDTVQATVEDGWITLSGTVGSDYQRKSAQYAVSHLLGVMGVSNSIVLTPTAEPVAVKEAIEKAFKRDAELEARGLTVTTKGGSVTLTGKIKSWDERDRAGMAAWNAPGVTAVDNNLVVVM